MEDASSSSGEVPKGVGGASRGGVAGGEGRVWRPGRAGGGGGVASGRGGATCVGMAWEGGVAGGEGGSASGGGVAGPGWVFDSCAFLPGGEGAARGGERPLAEGVPFLGGVTCGGRITGSPLDLACEGCPRARGAAPAEVPERAGEARGVALEPRGREAGLCRPPLALGRLLEAGLGSALLLRSGVLLTDFLAASVGGLLGRAPGVARGTFASAPTAARDGRERDGEGACGEGPEASADREDEQVTWHFRTGPPLRAPEIP